MKPLTLKEAIKQIGEELSALSREDFFKELEKYKDGDIARMLMESGAIYDWEQKLRRGENEQR